MPKPDDNGPQPEPPPVRPPTLPPDFPDIPQNPTPSCSRLLTPPRPQTRLRAQRLLRLTRSGASGLKSGERDGSYRDRDRKWPLLDTLPTEWATKRVRVNALPAIPFGLST
jgi:hypothetical protein